MRCRCALVRSLADQSCVASKERKRKSVRDSTPNLEDHTRGPKSVIRSSKARVQNIAPPVDSVRSRIMRSVRRKNTGAEVRVRSVAHGLGLRFRLHRRDLPGSPDLVFPRLRVVVFVHGCFWHRHPGCTKASIPKTRAMFWADKFSANVARDIRVCRELREAGWRVLIIWECQTSSSARIMRRLRRLQS